ncbi:hypothetical protein MMC14_010374 [Varicellaria rhodocarpa]|nr:hypothetical protein [Varicellaria rhodocarpa]
MSEDQDLLSRISNLAGQINQHKNQIPPQKTNNLEQLNSGSASSDPHPVGFHSQITRHGFRCRGSFGRARNLQPHRNRSIVLNSTASSKNIAEGSSVPPSSRSDHLNAVESLADLASPASTSWVSKRDRHMQLINSSIYDKESETRNKAMEQTRQRNILVRNQREKHKIFRHLQILSTNSEHSPSNKSAELGPAVFEITIGGLCFHVIDGGSKLLRKPNPADPPRSTPKRALVGGVCFLRSKNGNLYRSGLVKAKRNIRGPQKITEPCKRFSTTDVHTEIVNDTVENSDGNDLSSEGEKINEIEDDDVDSEGLVDDVYINMPASSNHGLHDQDDFIQF